MKDMSVKQIAEAVTKRGRDPKKITRTDKFDRFAAHRIYGLLMFAVVMFVVFFISQTLTATFTEQVLVSGLENLQEVVAEWFDGMGTSPIISGLIVEGAIGSFIAVIGFLPLIIVLFFLLTMLEDSGYMARVSLVMDRYFRRVGLSGKSIIPMYVGTACSIPGIMSARTIKNEKQSRMTALLTPFMPCGAKLPVIALLVGIFFNETWYTVPLIYLASIAIIFLGALLIKLITNTNFDKAEDTFMFIELPEYKLPSLRYAFLVMFERGKEFVIKAATIIVIFNTLLWLLMNFDFSFNFLGGESIEDSILHSVVEPFAVILKPMGIGHSMAWGFLAAAVIGFIAKENVVAAIAIIFSLTHLIDPDSFEGVGNISEAAAVLGISGAAGLAFMVFNLYTPPCAAAIGTMMTELGSRVWTLFAIAFQLLSGYILAILTYQVGSLVLYQELGMGFIAALIILMAYVVLVIYLAMLAKKGKGLAKL